MLDDDERRSLDATAALLALDDPRLAAQLEQHRLIPPRRRREPGPPAPPPRPARSWRISPAAWPPLVVFVLCLTLLLLPSVLAGRGRSAESPTSGPTTTEVVPDRAAPR